MGKGGGGQRGMGEEGRLRNGTGGKRERGRERERGEGE